MLLVCRTSLRGKVTRNYIAASIKLHCETVLVLRLVPRQGRNRITRCCEQNALIDLLQCAALAVGMHSVPCLKRSRMRDLSRLKEQGKSIVAKSAEIQ